MENKIKALEAAIWVILVGGVIYMAIEERKEWSCETPTAWGYILPVVLLTSVISCVGVLCQIIGCTVKTFGISTSILGLVLSSGLGILSINQVQLPVCAQLSKHPIFVVRFLLSLTTIGFGVTVGLQCKHG